MDGLNGFTMVIRTLRAVAAVAVRCGRRVRRRRTRQNEAIVRLNRSARPVLEILNAPEQRKNDWD